MADALSTHIGKLGRSKNTSNTSSSAEILSTASSMNRNRLLEGIHVYRVHDQSELLMVISQLPNFLKIHTKVRLIVIDSIAFHFRQVFELDYSASIFS